MTVEPQIIHRDRDAAHVADRPDALKAKPKRAFARTYVPGAVDLGHAAGLKEWGYQAARVCDVAKSIDVAVDAVLGTTCQLFDEERAVIREAFRRRKVETKAAMDALENRVGAQANEIESLKLAIERLKGARARPAKRRRPASSGATAEPPP